MGEMWLNNFEIIHSTHPDYIRDVVRGIMVPHQLIPLVRDAQLDTVVRGSTLSALGFYYIRYGEDVCIKLDEPTGTYFAVQIPLSGRAVIESNSEAFASTTKRASVVSPHDDLKMKWLQGCDQLICQIGKAALESHLAGLLGRGLRTPLWFRPAMDVSKGRGLAVRTTIIQMARRINRGDERFGYGEYIRKIEQELMTELLYGHWHNYSDALFVEPKAATSREIQYAVDLLQSHPEREHTVHDVAICIGISVRGLQRGFQRQLGTTFQALLRDIRLQRVHDELRAADPDMVTVTYVMNRWNTHPGGSYFRRYRQLFGESPAETLKRAH